MTNKVKKGKDTDFNQTRESEPVNILLPLEVIDFIEEALFHFRKMLPRETRKRLSRSRLYALILEDILTEFCKNKNSQNVRLNKIVSAWQQTINN